ncbi:MAG: hypothetical protein K940chlam9_00723 [Chlamydiae bacterium]|nr:hypothetical protein [Chlamydiota bacterium]
MTLAIQTLNLPEPQLTALDLNEGENAFPDAPKGKMESAGKSREFTSLSMKDFGEKPSNKTREKTDIFSKSTFLSKSSGEKENLFSLSASQSQKTPEKSPSPPLQNRTNLKEPQTEKGTSLSQKGTPLPQAGKEAIVTPKTPPQPSLGKEGIQKQKGREETKSLKETRATGQNREASSSPLNKREWVKQPTLSWWETRHEEKERQGRQQQEDDEKASALEGIRGKKVQIGEGERVIRKKPLLTPPKIGVFALYYILTKMGIHSDGTASFSHKKEIEHLDEEMSTAHKERLQEMKKAIDKEASSKRWGVMAKFFSWVGSLVGIIAGAALIATGVGAVAGAMLITAGVIQITNQLLEITGGWNKIAELLPGDDPMKKQAVIAWMQMGISILCIVLSGVGMVWGGFGQIGEATQTAMALIGGFGAMAHGAATIGEGVTNFLFNDKMAQVKQYELRLAQLKHARRDLMEMVEQGTDRLEQLFEDLSRALDFQEELFRADQMVIRR